MTKIQRFGCSTRFNKLCAAKFAHCCAFFFSLIVPFFHFLSNEASGAVEYAVVDLAPGAAICINNSGTVGGEGSIWDANQGRTETGMGWTYVNDSGLVAGSYTPSDTDSRSCLWDPIHGITDLGVPGYKGYGTAINNNGIVTCWYGPIAGGGLYAFIWKPLEGMQRIPYRPGMPSGESAAATDINASGKVLVNAFNYDSFIWGSVSNGLTTIPVTGGRARAFNGNGDVVFDNVNAVWTSTGGLTYFACPPFCNQCNGRGINNLRQVVGIGPNPRLSA